MKARLGKPNNIKEMVFETEFRSNKADHHPFFYLSHVVLLFNTETLRKETREITHTFLMKLSTYSWVRVIPQNKLKKIISLSRSLSKIFEIVNSINAHCHVQVWFNKSRPCMSQQKQITKKQENIDFD